MPEPFPLATQGEVTDPYQSFPKKASSWIDQFFAPVGEPLGRMAGAVGAGAARMFAPQYEQQWRTGAEAAGRALPRTAAEAFLTSRAKPLAKLAGFGDVALQSYAGQPEIATLPQKLGATALQTAAFQAAPQFGGGAGRAIAEKLAPGSTVARRVGSTLGTVGGFEAANLGSAAITQQPYEPLTPEHIAGTVASVLPWEVGQMWYERIHLKNQAKRGEEDAELTQQREEVPVMAETMAVRKEKQPFLGNVHQGEVRAIPLPEGPVYTTEDIPSHDAHPELGDLRQRFRFHPEGNYIKWTDQPTAESWAAVDNWLAKRGYSDTEHTGLFGLRLEQPPTSPETMLGRERLTHAAYRPTEDQVEYGANHPEILSRLGVTGFEQPESRNTPQFGFRTNLRPFVTREEAGPIATEAGQNLKQFDVGEPVHSDEVSGVPGTEKPMSEGMPKLDERGRLKVAELEEIGIDTPSLENVAKRLTITQKLPGETKAQFLTRAYFPEMGLHNPNDPTALLSTTERYFRSAFGENGLNLPKEQVDRYTYFGLRLAATLGHTQNETRVLPLTSEHVAGVFVPSRSGVPNAFIGLRQTKDFGQNRQIFDMFHSFAHELVHGVFLQVPGKTYGRSTEKMNKAVRNILEITKDMTTKEMGESIEHTLNMMSMGQRAKALDFRKDIYTEDARGRIEYIADLLGLHAMASAADQRTEAFKATKDFIKFGNGTVTDLARGMLKDFASVANVLRDYAQSFLGWKPSTMQKLDALHENFKQLIATGEQADNAIRAFMQNRDMYEARPWAPIEPVQYDKLERWMKALGAEPYDYEMKELVKNVSNMVVPQRDKEFPKELELGKHLNWLQHFVATPQMARQLPQLADMAWLGRNYGSMAQEFVRNVSGFFINPETGKLDIDSLRRMMRDGSQTGRAFNKILLRQNELEKERSGQRLTQEELNGIKEYKELSQPDREYIDFMLDKRAAAMVYTAKKRYDSFRNKVGHQVARVLQTHDRSLKWQEAEQLGHALATTHLDQDINVISPHTGQPVDEQLWRDKVAANKLLNMYTGKGPQQMKAWTEATKVFINEDGSEDQNLGAKLKNWREKLLGKFGPDKDGVLGFEGKPGYHPEVRIGRWLISYQRKGPDGKPDTSEAGTKTIGFKTYKEFKTRFDSLNSEYTKGKLVYLKPHDKTDTMDRFAGMSPREFTSYNEAVEALNNKVIAQLSRENPEFADSIAQQLREELKPSAAITAMMESPYMKERDLVGGREELNMAEGMVHYLNNTAYSMSKTYEAGQHELYLNDPKMRDNPGLQKIARQYFHEITDPTDRGYSWLKKLIAFNYIFFSPSLAFVEMTQQGTNHVPALVMEGMGLGEAWKSVASANKEVADAWREGKRLKVGWNVYGDKETTDVIKQARAKGIVGGGTGWLQEVWPTHDDMAFLNKMNVWAGNGKVIDSVEYLGNAMNHLYRVGANLHGIAIAQNTEVAFLTAYRHFKGQGLTKEVAFRKADDLVHESMHGGGKASRPLWFLGIGPGSPGATVGGLMYSLQMYVYNTVAQMANYLSAAVKNTAKNPTELTAAHKAAASMLGAQLVLAGVAGIPITGQMIALIEQAFPNTEPRRRMREAFFGAGKWVNSKLHLANQDEDFGRFVSTAASDGLMNAVAPWNMANRFELGVMMGVDPYRGFNWANVVGPGGPMLENLLLKGAPAVAQSAMQGNYAQGLEQAIPNTNLKRMAGLLHDGFDLRNKDERLNIQMDDSEKALYAMGFTPKRVAEFRQEDQMKKRAEKVHSLEQKKFTEEMANRLQAGADPSTITQALLERAHSVRGYDPRTGAREIAKVVQDRTIPYDPLRTGSKTSRAYTLGQLFDQRGFHQANQPTEASRAFQRAELTGRLGFPSPVTRRELREAQLVDQLLAANPTMSREEAEDMLMGVLRPRTAMWSGAP